ncbi:hypothetical protein QQF73_06360 [Marinobacter sp. M216]|uniref:Uncharacterized protein n=1 Tax=Marinobacter albus TaxID=3030833 RepID=A0ABT7HCN2_9GAMM|nr:MULTISPECIES: hypothetical protein [unclassified Marinobacter]MBW7470487.1 hypothetical protein [Marinobacter sp. F4218]MDK9557245.1 hypothetical protein [Marinobacter sp. M216]
MNKGFVNKFVIYSPLYRENSGGIIVLHKLASILNSMGYEAKIWPKPKPSPRELNGWRGWLKLARWLKIRLLSILRRKDLRSPYNLKFARTKDLKGSVVVYPEIVEGNPLGSEKVVRWLLNKPGAISGKAEFGEEDLFFYYNEHFNDFSLNPNRDRRLNVVELMGHVYKTTNHGGRQGQCFMVRKGRDREHTYHDPDAVQVDGFSHEELAKAFNDHKYFISYDLYTMYSRFAAMCGCIPVVVPQQGLRKEVWRPEVHNRYGIAYGWDDIAWALETRVELVKFLCESERSSVESVRGFIRILEHHFDD